MKLVHDPMPAGEHRPDIEGLRAVAVVAVVLFHLSIFSEDWGWAGGGFIGVDVFFVISGFLIGGIVVRELGEGGFSFRDYLVRRVKRIVPVMLVMLAVVTVFACLVLMPSELEGYGWSLGFSALFLSNFHFWLHRGTYAESEYEVLLHTWTLGVEAQFYLLLPLIVLLLMRLGRNSMWLGLVALALVSAAVSLLFPSASFYTLPARLWEFVLGMMVAITPLAMVERRWVREVLALIGLALIAYATVTFHSDTPFPGWRAAIPCLGAAAIIAAGNGGSSLVGWLLELPPVRFIGKISYSLYLWHWPVIVLFLLSAPAAELNWLSQLFVVGTALILSVLSWRFVEEPFRKRSFPERPVMVGSGVVTATLVGFALLFSVTSGWPSRLSPENQKIAASMEYPLDEVFRSGTCFIHHRSQSFDEETCVIEDDGRPRVLLIGDSHAAHLWPGLSSSFPGSAVSQITAAGCRPLLGHESAQYAFCTELVGGALKNELEEKKFDLVILAGRWERDDLESLRTTIEAFKRNEQEVLLVGPVREWAQFVPRLLVLAGGSETYATVDAMQVEGRGKIEAGTALIAMDTGVFYASIYSNQCAPHCEYIGSDGVPLIVDNSHFTFEASARYAGQFYHPFLVREVK